MCLYWSLNGMVHWFLLSFICIIINFTNFLSILPWIGQASKYFLCNNHQDSLSASIMHDNFVIHINVAVCKDINYQEDIIWVILCQILCTLITVVECELQSCLKAFCVYLFLRTIWSDLKIELQNDHAGFQTSHCFLWCQEKDIYHFQRSLV